jgi:ornithine decarboxylase
VSFHVGSACQNLAAFTAAIQKAREVFDAAAELGIGTMELLDLGGGFTGRWGGGCWGGVVWRAW